MRHLLATYDTIEPRWEVVFAASRRDSVALRQWQGAMTRAPEPPYMAGIAAIRYVHDGSAAVELLERLAEFPEPGRQLAAHVELAKTEVARGRWSAATEHLAEVSRLDPVTGMLLRGHIITLPFLDVPDADVRAAQEKLRSWSAPAHDVESAALSDVLLPHARIYLLGMIASKQGHDSTALRHAAALDTMQAPARAAAVPRDMGTAIRADVAVRRGEYARALALLARANGHVPLELMPGPGATLSEVMLNVVNQEHARYLRALSLQNLGRDEDAAAWWQHGFAETPSETMYLARIHQQLGEIHERANRHQAAREAYGVAARLWQRSEGPLAAEYRRVQSRLSGLLERGEGTR